MHGCFRHLSVSTSIKQPFVMVETAQIKPDSLRLTLRSLPRIALLPHRFVAAIPFALGLIISLQALFTGTLSAQITQSFSDRPVQAFAEPVFEQRPEVSMFEPFGEGERRGEDIEFESEEEMERIETERHDFTQSTTVVGRGVTQVEFGYTFFQNSNEAEVEDSHATPELLIRYGLTDRLEFRIRYNEVWQFGEEDRSGSEDIHWAFKVRTTEQFNLRPESALEIRFTAPTGGVDWSTDEVEFGLDYIYGWKLNSRTEFYGSSGFSTNALGEFAFRPIVPADEEFMLYTQSFAIGTELTERCTVYSEFFGLFTDGFEDDEERPVFFNVGLDFYLSDNVVLDVRGGTGINGDADDLFFGMGGAFRF